MDRKGEESPNERYLCHEFLHNHIPPCISNFLHFVAMMQPGYGAQLRLCSLAVLGQCHTIN